MKLFFAGATLAGQTRKCEQSRVRLKALGVDDTPFHPILKNY
jgi:hypothetical protein